MASFSMQSSILNSTKAQLGIPDDCASFDSEILISINSALLALRQIGIGKSDFFVFNESDTFLDLLGEDFKDVGSVALYLYCKTRLVFDPPNSTVQTALKDAINECEWRLNANNAITPGSSDSDILDIDYRKLKNLPKINNQVLVDNYDEIDPLSPKEEIPNERIAELWNGIFNKGDDENGSD